MLIKRIFIIACFFVTAGAAAQDQIVTRGDTLILPNGSKFWIGEQITLGNGSAPNGSFNFIYFRILNIKKKQLKAAYSQRTATIKKFERDGNYKNSNSYNIIVLEFGRHEFEGGWCDVVGALTANEIVDPHPVNRPVNKPVNRQVNKPVDKPVNKTTGGESKEARLAKLKRLYDSGDINKDEYETLRNKILNEKAPNVKKNSAAPVVF